MPIRGRTTITPLAAWFESLPENVRQAARSYAAKAGGGTGEVAWDFIRSVWSSKSGLAIAPLQDLLNLGVEGRMNVPGITRWQLALALHRANVEGSDL